MKASGGVFVGLVRHVVKCKHYSKVKKEPMKAFKYTKTFVFRNRILVVVWNKLSLWARMLLNRNGVLLPITAHRQTLEAEVW